ncbi:MAG: CpXC domain-containing protein [Bacteroidales bacterium]|nr:CpXC domain-containing protein [Bacteroidales bacterium]
MATLTRHSFRCPACGAEIVVQGHDLINVREQPELKAPLISGELFLQTCPQCGRRHLVTWPLVYLDPDEMVLLMLSDKPLAMADTGGYTARLVPRVGDLIEKVKIFDAGLDDKAVELCKYVTKQDAGKPEADLRFLRLDGADNEIVFTYPAGGQMELLAVGFNVYEDCRGILARNPSVSGRAQGLAIIDEAWVSSLLR